MPTIHVVTVTLVVLVGLLGVLVGWLATRALRRRPAGHAMAPPSDPATVVPVDVLRGIAEVMNLALLVLDTSGGVMLANAAARSMGVLRDGRLVVDTLQQLARETRQDGEPRQVIVDLSPSRLSRGPSAVSAHVVPLDLPHRSGWLALFLEDVTEALRLAAVRRDFVANVSHELKTPVGAMTLLAEAMQDACDDPQAVRRFSARMQTEGIRLGALVQELIELSRLQGADPLPSPQLVSVDEVVTEAVDATWLSADAVHITVVTGGERGLRVRGDKRQLTMAVRNLLGNAIAYSPPGTRVAVGTRVRTGDVPLGEGERPSDIGETVLADAPTADAWVELTVADQGIGIADADLERIFERFYRADPARSRATGGTGLGLAIVKHVVTNHGGTVRVWSVEGSGSTFTIRLPAAPAPSSGRSLDPSPPAVIRRTATRQGRRRRVAAPPKGHV